MLYGSSFVSTKQLTLAGRILHFMCNWELMRDAWVLNAIRRYELDLVSIPYQCVPPKKLTFARDEIETLETEINNMTLKGAICAAVSQGFYSQMFTVSKKDGGHKPTINLTNLNRFVRAQHIKMESINRVQDILSKNDYMTKKDLKDAYFMVPIGEKHRDLLRFKQSLPVQQLPLGLSSAPRFYQDHEANHGCLEIPGSQDDHVHRRYTRVRDSVHGTHGISDLPVGEPGNGNKLPQISAHPISDNRIPGLHNRLQDNGTETARGKDQVDQGRRETPSVTDRQQCFSFIQISWAN